MVSRPRRTGFSLLELVIAGTIMLVLVVFATQVFGSLVLVHRRDVERSRMRAASDLVLSTLARDLRHAGLGVPEGGNVSTGAAFPPAVFQAGLTEVGFLADLPRPDAALNGYSELAGDQPSASMVVLLNELSGDCGSDTGSSCSTESMSLAVRPAGVAGCGASATAPTCPWAQQRYRAGERVIVANGLGTWAEMTVGGSLSTVSGGRRGLALTGAPSHIGGANLPRRGFVSTPDRVFYRLDGGDAVQRGQCWGGPGTSDACVTGAEGSGWETLARDVSRFELAFHRADGSAIAPLPATVAAASATRRVSVLLELSRTVADQPLSLSTQTTLATRR
ncbi:MAG TPA: hypothetical protein VGK67_11450 [Myxococcales bacterium]|jgi:uncharacterized protein